MLKSLTPPNADEYEEDFSEYVGHARSSDVMSLLQAQLGTLHLMLDHLSNEQACYRFGPEGWSIKQLVGHLADVERVWAYRLFRISRSDSTPLAGFNSSQYVADANHDERSLPDLLQEFELLRRSTLLMISNLTEEMLGLEGIANDHRITVRALIYMLPGHVEHHLESLRKNYLPAISKP